MGAALGATGNVDRERTAEKRLYGRGDRGRRGAGSDVRGGTDRRSRTGDDIAARIAGAAFTCDDEDLSSIKQSLGSG